MNKATRISLLSLLLPLGCATTHAYVPDPLVRIKHPAPIHVTVTTGKPSIGAGQP